jgi:hypothetical protein
MVERGDFGCGTSSKSTKLVHGGVRYLEVGGFQAAAASVCSHASTRLKRWEGQEEETRRRESCTRAKLIRAPEGRGDGPVAEKSHGRAEPARIQAAAASLARGPAHRTVCTHTRVDPPHPPTPRKPSSIWIRRSSSWCTRRCRCIGVSGEEGTGYRFAQARAASPARLPGTSRANMCACGANAASPLHRGRDGASSGLRRRHM